MRKCKEIHTDFKETVQAIEHPLWIGSRPISSKPKTSASGYYRSKYKETLIVRFGSKAAIAFCNNRLSI